MRLATWVITCSWFAGGAVWTITACLSGYLPFAALAVIYFGLALLNQGGVEP